MTPVTVLSIQPVAERGGSDQALVRMIRRMPAGEFDWHVAVPAPHPLAAEFADAGATVHVVPMQRITTRGSGLRWLRYALAWPAAVWRLTRLTRRIGAGVVHSNSLHSWYGWAVALVTRRPHVWHARETVTQSTAALRLERFLARRCAARVLACSAAVADQLDPANVEVCLELEAPGFGPDHAGTFRLAAGLPDDVPLVGLVGRIWPGKGIDVALGAFESAREIVPEARLVVVGEALPDHEAYAADLHTRCAAQPGVHWLGHRSDIPEVMADLDLLAVPSTHPEPFGLVAVEALTSGVPVVVSGAGGAPEIVSAAADGAGDVVPVGDVDALANAMAARLRGVETSTELRRGRSRLLGPSWPDYPKLFNDVVGS